ncbi:MAG: hypothetical protein WHU93_01920, partial [Arcobacteraceae bacterium]
MKVVFFGVGAVSSVIARVLYELSQKSSKNIEFLFIVRDTQKAKTHFFKNTELLENGDFLEVTSFDDIFLNHQNYKSYL